MQGREKENDREQIILKYIASLQEDDIVRFAKAVE
jgi:hypothetical protein